MRDKTYWGVTVVGGGCTPTSEVVAGAHHLSRFGVGPLEATTRNLGAALQGLTLVGLLARECPVPGGGWFAWIVVAVGHRGHRHSDAHRRGGICCILGIVAFGAVVEGVGVQGANTAGCIRTSTRTFVQIGQPAPPNVAELASYWIWRRQGCLAARPAGDG